FSGGLSRQLSRREDEVEKGCAAQLVVASIQKLSRAEELLLLAGERFDYCVIDEVHHAEAPSYRRVMARLDAGFTLGLTATPERTDGVDVATLFDDILVASDDWRRDR
ncbi:MAG: DEAD/DEAH box helicase family protein, partial [Verrucomicrobia bacterium]|nr:DEAD/DEAH box helicase family protein [Verrucomicrobiota bacterium]